MDISSEVLLNKVQPINDL